MVEGDDPCEAHTTIVWGRLSSRERYYAAEAEAVDIRRQHVWNRYARFYRSAVVEDPITHKRNKPELGRSRVWPFDMCRSGPHGEGDEPKPMDERAREVRPRCSSCEVHERSWVTGGGVDGAKGGDQGKCGLAKHAPNTASGSRVTSAGTHTASRLFRACRQTPEVGAVCGKAARTGSVRGAHSNMRPYRDKNISKKGL